MIEVITYHSPEAQRQLQVLDEFMASLDADRLLSTNDLYEAAKSYKPGPDAVLTDKEKTIFDEIDAQNNVVASVADVITIEGKISNVVPRSESASYPRLKRSHEKAKKLVVSAGKYGVALTVVMTATSLISNKIDSMQNNVKADNTTATISTASSIYESISEPVTDISTIDTVPVETPTAAPVQLETPATNVTTPESTTTEPLVAVAETVPVLSLSQRIASGETKLSDQNGQMLGILQDKYCNNIQLYVGNPIAIFNENGMPIQANIDVLSDEAKMKAQYLIDHPELKTTDKTLKRMLEDDIKQSGLSNGSGDPMYSLFPVTPEFLASIPQNDCVPAGPNPRDRQLYGSTEATAEGKRGSLASDYIAVGDLSEFGNIPGSGETIYVELHRSSQNAGGAGFEHYIMGDTADYTVDGQLRQYEMTGKILLDAQASVPEFIHNLNSMPNGRERLVVQICTDGNPAVRTLVILESI